MFQHCITENSEFEIISLYLGGRKWCTLHKGVLQQKKYKRTYNSLKTTALTKSITYTYNNIENMIPHIGYIYTLLYHMTKHEIIW